jgi:phage terminase large subunit-like protein
MDMFPLRRTILLGALSDEECEELFYDWSLWARKDQRAPGQEWIYWLILAGRGAGKTRVGSEVVRQWSKYFSYVNLIGPTQDDVRDVMVEGESGILSICPDGERPHFSRASQRLDWPNGSVSLLFSAEEPDRLRGKQHTKLWMDELAAWRRPETFDQAAFGLRLGTRPQAIITTTPRPIRIIKSLLADRDTVVTRATTFENRNFLPSAFVKRIVSRYEGRAIGLQELHAEIVEEAPGALWTREQIERRRLPVDTIQDYGLIVIGVDPPARSGSKADECGIVVVGKTVNGHIHVLADLTSQGETPGQWGARVCAAYRRYKANRVVAEINNGGDMVVEVLRQTEPNLPVRKVTATRGKFARAEPVATAYERGVVHHIGVFQALEDQLCTLTPDFDSRSHGFSPDRADALVWAITDLIEPEVAQTLLEYYASCQNN